MFFQIVNGLGVRRIVKAYSTATDAAFALHRIFLGDGNGCINTDYVSSFGNQIKSVTPTSTPSWVRRVVT